jgi:hypothetical protein
MIGYTTPLAGAELERYLKNREKRIENRSPPVLATLPYSTEEERQERLDAITEMLYQRTLARTGQRKTMW